MVKLDNEPTAMWDLMGKDAALFHYSADADPDSIGLPVRRSNQARWFHSIWTSVARATDR